MFKALKQDYKTYNLNLISLFLGFFTLHSFWLVFIYRLANWFYKRHIPLIPGFLTTMARFLYAAEISPVCEIGPGFMIAHSAGIVIGYQSIIGQNFHLFQNVTIGSTDKMINGRLMPVIGNNVSAFAGAIIIGPIIIGDNVSIGAGSVVAKDIPANVTIAGNPARIMNTVNIPDSLKCMNSY